MTYADNRDLRRELYMAYNTKCTHNNEYNNLEIVKRIVNIHMEIAQLLGYDNYAEYTLKKRMAETSDAVYTFSTNCWMLILPQHAKNMKQYRS